jgi:NADH-quinone oxidoreductase subunit D/NADH-quinone oxidoreductase subunit C/D
MCVEKGMQIEVPRRAKVIRVFWMSLTRIASHELWWGALAMDLVHYTVLFTPSGNGRNHGNNGRNCGARLTMNYHGIPVLMNDLHPIFSEVKALSALF